VVVVSYWIVSISMVFLNKYLLSGIDLNAPIFITWSQCIVAIGVCYVFGLLSKHIPNIFGEIFPIFHIDLDIAKKMLPLSCAFVGMIALNNLCLQYLGIAFYNVGRSLSTVFNVIFTYLFLHQKTSLKALLACAAIVFGFLLGVNQEGEAGTLSIIGVFFGIIASMCVALNAIFVKKYLPIIDNNEWKMTLYNNFNAALLFLPVMMLLGEFGELVKFSGLSDLKFWILMFISGLMGVAISIVTTLQIKFTSPLTHNVSGTAKACAQTVLAVFAYHEFKTLLWWVSNAMVLGG